VPDPSSKGLSGDPARWASFSRARSLTAAAMMR
jgi:hypothetical protein